MTVLSIAYPFAPVGRDAAGGAEQVLSQMDRGLEALNHRSLVVACEGSQTAGTLIPTPRLNRVMTPALCGEIHRQHALNIERALREFEVDVIHMHALDFHRYLPRPGLPLLVTLHLPVAWYPRDIFSLDRPGTWFNCVSRSQRQACPQSARLLPEVENGVPVEELASAVTKGNYALALGEEILQAQQLAAAELSVEPDNALAQKLYERRGYVPVGEATPAVYRDPVTPPHPQIIMRKPLLSIPGSTATEPREAFGVRGMPALSPSGGKEAFHG